MSLISISEASRRLGLNVKTLYDDIKATGTIGGVPVTKVGTRKWVSAEEIDRISKGAA